MDYYDLKTKERRSKRAALVCLAIPQTEKQRLDRKSFCPDTLWRRPEEPAEKTPPQKVGVEHSGTHGGGKCHHRWVTASRGSYF